MTHFHSAVGKISTDIARPAVSLRHEASCLICYSLHVAHNISNTDIRSSSLTEVATPLVEFTCHHTVLGCLVISLKLSVCCWYFR